MGFLIKVIISSSLIVFCAWLGKEKPQLAGFIIALPLSTILVLGFNYSDYQDAQATERLAKSIFLAIPLSLVFFAPFLLPLKMGFWMKDVSGMGLVAVSYVAHKAIYSLIKS